MNSFKRFNENKLCARKYFYSSTKGKKNSEDSKLSDDHVSIEDYMVCERICDKFKMKNMGDYYDHCLKKDVLLLADIFESLLLLFFHYSLYLTSIIASSKKYTNSNRQRNTFISLKKKKKN